MQIVVLYLVTAVVFLLLDAAMLILHMQPLFRRHIGALMTDDPRLVPAALFYAGYVAGLLYLVSYPALRTGAPVLLPAMVLGALAYGTFEFTNYAILKDWHPAMVATDLIWGTVLTGVSAWAGVAATRALWG